MILIVLIVLAGLCANRNQTSSTGGSTTAVSGSTTEEKAQKEPASEKDSKQKQNQESTVGVGEAVSAGDIEWTVTNASTTNQLSQTSFGQFGNTKQGNFVVVDLSFKNNGNKPSTLSPQSLTLLDSNDRESNPDTDTIGYIDNDRNIFLEQVNPGVTKEGTVIFTVAPGSSGFKLQVGDANMFSNKEAYVDLGF